MAILKNAKHEKFAIGVARGETAESAYVSAGYKPAGARAAASRLLAKLNISARVAELKAAITALAVKQAGVDEAWVRTKAVELFSRCVEEKSFNPSVALGALRLLGDDLGMFDSRRTRVPLGMPPPIGDEVAPTVVNNTQINVGIAALNAGGVQAVHAYFRKLRGLDKGPSLPNAPALRSPD